ncbi:ABC transporter [Microbacterium sp. Leaf288]|uniref:sugar ABC transporter ATP-binding protein n=1 Tax=Microbacterium sp. Leaf288 TaxID=1736323 RepID=UPI000701D81B|nr:sugar ABC transporter ATP-binding protein [Microbacterium sp. Leaf288]KQP67855.1 ABC transporter [Microbacterium sp. Leaf288]
MVEPLLTATGVSKSYGAVRALKSVDLEVRPGEAHALLGANGAGKSTFVKILTGVVGLDAGSLEMDDGPLALANPHQGLGRGIASVFQDPALIPDLTVVENCQLTGSSVPRVRAELEKMGLGALDLREKASRIPLPFQRMIDLARALSHEPRLLILDEITAALPRDLAEKVFEVMAEQVARDRAVLFISHRLDEVIRYCTMCTVFRDGYTVATFAPTEGGERRIVASMLGEEAAVDRSDFIERAPVELGETFLQAELVTSGQAEDVTFEVRSGEVVGIIALEGQGQDDLFSCLAGQTRVRSGAVTLRGTELKASHPADAIRKGLVLVPSDRLMALLPQRPVHESIALPLHAPLRKWGPFSLTKERKVVASVIDRLSIDTRAAAQSRRLSGGNQQKLTIGRWLAAGFDTILLFDPTRGIDIGAKHQIYDLVRDLAADGKAVLMYTSELREANLVCDRILVLRRGTIVGELNPRATEKEMLQAMYGVIEEEVSE